MHGSVTVLVLGLAKESSRSWTLVTALVLYFCGTQGITWIAAISHLRKIRTENKVLLSRCENVGVFSRAVFAADPVKYHNGLNIKVQILSLFL